MYLVECSSLSDENKFISTCYHEAGHVVAANHFGLDVMEVTCRRSRQSKSGYTRFEGVRPNHTDLNIIAMSGVVGAFVGTGYIVIDSYLSDLDFLEFTSSAKQDIIIHPLAVKLMENMKGEFPSLTDISPIIGESQRIILKSSDNFNSIVKALRSRESLFRKDIKEILG